MTKDQEANANIVHRKRNVKICSRLHRFKIRLGGGQL